MLVKCPDVLHFKGTSSAVTKRAEVLRIASASRGMPWIGKLQNFQQIPAFTRAFMSQGFSSDSDARHE